MPDHELFWWNVASTFYMHGRLAFSCFNSLEIGVVYHLIIVWLCWVIPQNKRYADNERNLCEVPSLLLKDVGTGAKMHTGTTERKCSTRQRSTERKMAVRTRIGHLLLNTECPGWSGGGRLLQSVSFSGPYLEKRREEQRLNTQSTNHLKQSEIMNFELFF
jgi:hypothetical protein